ncbi:MAG: BrnA antitoxin family protein [Rhodospirillaceae bacterium]
MSETTIIRRSPGDRRTGKSDWARLGSRTDTEIEAAVASDADAAPILDTSWYDRALVVRRSKQLISLRLDAEILDYFRASGRNYQSRMNAVLRSYVEHCKEQERLGAQSDGS